jgi:hypothetical protein
MFEPQSSPKPPEIAKLVEETRQQARVPAPVRPPGLWKLVLLAHGAAGIVTGKGPNVYAGGSFTAERVLVDRWFLGAGMGASAGPFGSGDEFSLTGYEVAAHVAGYLGVPIRKVRIGPFIQFRAGTGTIMVSSPGVEREDYSFLSLFGLIGLDLRITLTQRAALKITVGVEASPLQTEIRRVSNDEIIQENSLLRAWGGLGFVLF